MCLRSFRARFFPHTGPATLRRFLKHTEAYVHGFGREAELREAGVVLDVESYNVLRRENSAVRYCFGLFGFLLGLDLPDEIFEHPIMMEMHLAAVDMVTWSNVSSHISTSPTHGLIFSSHSTFRTCTRTIWNKPWVTSPTTF